MQPNIVHHSCLNCHGLDGALQLETNKVCEIRTNVDSVSVHCALRVGASTALKVYPISALCTVCTVQSVHCALCSVSALWTGLQGAPSCALCTVARLTVERASYSGK